MSGPVLPNSPLGGGFTWRHSTLGPVLAADGLEPFARHFFTTRERRFRGAGEAEDWSALAREIGVDPARVLRPTQVHGCAVLIHRRGTPAPAWHGPRAPEADILVTDDDAAAVAVQVADCVPMLVTDPRSGAVAAAHAGWRGTVAGVAGATICALEEAFSARASDLVVALGPSIGPCCYEVGPELFRAFERAGFAGSDLARWFRPAARDGRLLLDLWSANRALLVAAGVSPSRVHACCACTVDARDHFFSYRVEGPGTGRTIAVIRRRT